MSRPLSRPAIELRPIHYFVTLAEELNFRRAAQRLFITQPALSRQIALLEKSLGVRLFQRDRRRVELTEAGTAILQDARHLLTLSDAVVATAQQFGDQDSAVLSVGFPEYTNRTIVPEIVAVFRARHPEVKLTLTEGYSRILLQELRDGRLDLGFMMIPPAEDVGDLQVELIIEEKSGVLLAASHPLARCSEIPAAALADKPLLLTDRSVNPSVYDIVAQWLEEGGIEPKFLTIGGSGAYTYDTALRVIQSGEAVSLGAASMAKDLPAGVVFRPLDGPSPRFRVGAVWSRSNPSPLLRAFLSVAREVRDADRIRVPGGSLAAR